MSINWLLDAEPLPAIRVLPPAAASLDEAHAAIELWEFYKRRTLDPTQRLVVEVMMATRADGLWAAPTTGREMPRQNGKGDEIEVPELWGLVQRGERILHTVHDAVLLATESQSRLLSVIEGHADLRRLKLRAWRGTGQQMIEMRNGGIIWYRTRTGGGARGVDEVDRIVVDEAQHAEEEHLAAITPTQLASANPQLNALGSAGISGRSAWWWRQRRRALAADPGDFGYVGHTAEDIRLDGETLVRSDVDVNDRAGWHRSNPALLRRPELLGFLEEQLRRLGPALFAREHLGVWDSEGAGMAPAKFDPVKWDSTLVDRSPSVVDGELTLAYDVHDGWASVSIAAGTLGMSYGECIQHRSGAGWLPAYLVEVTRRRKPWAISLDGGNGDAVAILGEVRQAFEEAGLDPELVKPLTSSLYRAACGAVWRAVEDGKATRPRVKPDQLQAAGEVASARHVGVDGGWVWDRSNAPVPLSPLVSWTIARALLSVEQPAAPRIFAY